MFTAIIIVMVPNVRFPLNIQVVPGADTEFVKGGGGGGGEIQEKNLGSGWTLVAPSCFALQVPDVQGLQVPGPPCASSLLK